MIEYFYLLTFYTKLRLLVAQYSINILRIVIYFAIYFFPIYILLKHFQSEIFISIKCYNILPVEHPASHAQPHYHGKISLFKQKSPILTPFAFNCNNSLSYFVRNETSFVLLKLFTKRMSEIRLAAELWRKTKRTKH